MKKVLVLVLGVALALAGTASAQIAAGNVYGVVKDDSGAVLPGVNVTVTGETGTRSTVSSADGAFRFLALNSGEYTVTLALTGFAKTVRRIRVTTGENVDIAFTMKVSGIEETVEVTAEAPLVDIKKRGTATTLATEELKDTPNSRDPWGIMNQVPGALIDRVNIAGNENGQQAAVAGKGSAAGDRVEPRRPGHHRHGRHRLLPDLFRLRCLPGDQRLHRRRRPRHADRRFRHEPRHQARHQHVPRRRPLHRLRREV